MAVSLSTVLLVGLMLLLRNDPVAAMRRMRVAVSHVRSAHMTTWWREGAHQQGAMEQIEELWYQQGQWRKRGPQNRGGDRIITEAGHGRTFYRYDPQKREVIARVEEGPQVTAFSLDALAGDYFPLGVSPQVSQTATVQEGGATLAVMVVTVSEQDQRMLFWVDTKTNLPVRAEKQVEMQGRWDTVGKVQFAFNQPLSGTLFDPHTLAQ